MTLRENIGEFWFDMSIWQKIAVVTLLVSLFALFLTTSVGWIRTSIEVRQQERIAAHAKAEADARNKAADAKVADAEKKLQDAAAIAVQVKQREDALAKEEEKLNEKYQQLSNARRVRDRDVREYDRAVAKPRTDDPNIDKLCVELADLGYPCLRRGIVP